MKEIKLLICDNYVDGIHCIYEKSDDNTYEW